MKRSVLPLALGIAMCINARKVNAQITLEANGPGNTYELINSQFGASPEVPDCGHASFGRHITEAFDSDLGKNVFVFHIHADIDNDRCTNFDRQRNEIKGGNGSPAGLKHTQGETAYCRWKFKLDAGFIPSSRFTHIMQIKAYDGDAGAPLMTLTPRAGNPQMMEVIHSSGGGSGSQGKILEVPLAPFKGTWVEAYMEYKSSEGSAGTFTLIIKRLSDGATLLSVTRTGIDLWRSGASFNRPKWGIYRGLHDVLRDEQVRFADFCVSESSAGQCPSDIGGGPSCSSVSASADDGNVPANVLDGNLNTRWSADGDGQWIQFCLGEDPETVSSVDVAFYNGDQRQAYFDIQLSNNGTSFTTVAANQQSSGSTLQPENFSISPQQARYVRLLGHGNSVNSWNSYTEVEINTQTSTTCTSPVTASGDDGNVAANVLDNDLNTRWSSSGDGEWVRFCLDNVVSVSGVQIAFYKGNERQAIFDIQLSTNGTSWTTVASNVTSSGTSLALETFTFPAQNAKYVRILGHGNTVNAWNSYTEVEISTGTSSSARLASGGEPSSSEGSSSVTVSYPNPARDKVTVQFRLSKESDVWLSVHNTISNETTILVNEHLPPGTHQTTFDVTELPRGLHLIKLICHGQLTTQKLMKE